MAIDSLEVPGSRHLPKGRPRGIPNKKARRVTYGTIQKRTSLPSKRTSIEDLHWAAGFLEGEGTFCRYGNLESRFGSTGSERVAARQKERECLDRLRDLFGGKVSSVITNHGNNVNGVPYGSIWNWQISGTLARGAMMTLFCLLSERRRLQIKRALGNGGLAWPVF